MFQFKLRIKTLSWLKHNIGVSMSKEGAKYWSSSILSLIYIASQSQYFSGRKKTSLSSIITSKTFYSLECCFCCVGCYSQYLKNQDYETWKHISGQMKKYTYFIRLKVIKVKDDISNINHCIGRCPQCSVQQKLCFQITQMIGKSFQTSTMILRD